MSDELLKRYAAAGAEGVGYQAEEEAVVADGLEKGAPEPAEEAFEPFRLGPESDEAIADLASGGAAAAADAVVAPEADEPAAEAGETDEPGDARSTGLVDRVKAFFEG